MMIVGIACMVSSLEGQSGKELYIGIQPTISIETESEQSELTMTLPSLILEAGITEMVHLRIMTSFEMLSSEVSILSHIGLQAGLPVYFLSGREGPASGFYLAPLGGFSWDQLNSRQELTIAFEPGYSWCFSSGFTMKLGIQLGGTRVVGGGGLATLHEHTEAVFSLGYTFRSN